MAKDTKKGLGRGLSELFGDDILDNESEGELIYAPIAKVEPRAEQPRSHFDDDALQELADSISQYGLIQPITVRRREGGFYQIIAGERRWAGKPDGRTRRGARARHRRRRPPGRGACAG